MPVIWLVDAYRAGERGQVRALAEALGWSLTTKTLHYREMVVWPHVLGQASLAGITARSRAQLRPPWPDLVVSSGVRNEPVCRWIRRQSGGHTRYVHVGRPWGPLDSFDLVITTPQYRVPDHPRVLNNALTLHSINADSLARAREQWETRFADLPHPRVAVVVGGDSGPFTLGPRAASRLGHEASELVGHCGGSLLVTTSARTRDSAVEALRRNIGVPHYFYRWRAQDPDNPYLGILACADRVIVTGDSIAMLSEACAAAKPVQIFDIGGMRAGAGNVSRDFRTGAILYAALLRWFWAPLSRDITRVHSRLCDAGAVTWLGEPPNGSGAEAVTDLPRAVAAVRALFGEV